MKKKLLFAVALVVMLGVCLFAAVGCESEPAVKTYTVTFDANGGTMKEATITVNECRRYPQGKVDLRIHLPG